MNKNSTNPDAAPNPTKSVKARSGIQVIARAASILRALENESDGLSLRQIAMRVDLPTSTVQRIVNALIDEHMLIAASLNARVKLGPTILRLASNTNFDFTLFVRPYLQELSQKINETVDLSIQTGNYMVFVDQVRGTQTLSAISDVGERLPMFSAANGKAALSLMRDDQITDLVKDTLIRETVNTVGSVPELLQQVQQIRETKIAIDNEEHAEGICAIGTAFCDPLGRIFAATIPVPSVRFYRLESSLKEALLEFRADLVEAISTPC